MSALKSLHRNTRFRIAFGNTIFFFILMGSLLLYFYFFTEKTLRKEEKAFLGHESMEFASILKQRGPSPRLKAIFDEELYDKPQYNMGFAVFDHEGNVLASGGNNITEGIFPQVRDMLKGRQSEEFMSLNIPGGREYTLAAAPVYNDQGQPLYYALVGSNLEVTVTKMAAFRKKAILVTPLLFLLSLGFGVILTGFALRPVREMERKIAALNITNLDRRIPLSGSGDDFDRLAESFNKMAERVQDAYRRISQFTSDASHELKTPLSIMRSEVEVTIAQPRKPEEYESLLTSHLDELDRLNHLIESLLLLARSDSDLLKMKKEKCDLKPLILETVDFFEPLLVQKNITLKTDLSPDVQAYADPGFIKQVCYNLLDNAIKFSRPGGSIGITFKKEEGWAVLKFSDTGFGIKDGNISRIFDRFYREDVSRTSAQPGHGLGLAICKAIMDAHGGGIRVKSSGSGTEFTVLLPLYN